MSSPVDGDAGPASPGMQNNVTRVSKVPAAISWTEDDNRTAFLANDPVNHDHVTLDIHVDHASHTAFFKVIANVAYKGKRNKSNVYLFIYPERIQTLARVDDDDDSATARLGTSAHSLQFTLNTPPSLVVPNGVWIPKNEARPIISSLHTLAGMNSFRVALPSNSISLDRLAIVCQEASTSGCLRTMADVANITKLYGGQGGRILEYGVDAKLPEPISPGHAKETRFDDSQVTESPPSYEELGSSSPHPPVVKKRRRLDSDADGSSRLEKMSLEDICRHGFMEMGRRFDRIEKSLSDLNSRLDRVEQLVQATHLGEPRSQRQENQQHQRFDERIEGVEGRVADVETRLEVGLHDLAQDVENQLYDVRHEFNDTITVRIEDEVGVAQSQLEDFVKDELRNVASDVEESVKETLRDALA